MVKRVPRLPDGPADHGAARPAGTALDAAHRLGAARGSQALPRVAGPIGASPTIVNTRLAELREAKLVRLDEDAGYRLTALGEELLRLFLPLHVWSEKWAKAVSRP